MVLMRHREDTLPEQAKRRGYRLERILTVDDRPEMLALQYGSLVPVSPFTGDPEGIAVNGEVIPGSMVYYRDRLGRELLHMPFGQRVIGPDSLFLFSAHHPRSFDSRYFGPVPQSSIISALSPLLIHD